MANETLGRRYAAAVFALAGEQRAIDRVGDDLAAIASTIEGDANVRDFFVAPTVDRESKQRVLRQAFEGRVHEIALHTLLLLVRKRRETLLSTIADEYRKLQLHARGAESLTIASARPLAPSELAQMVARLERLYARKFDATQVVDPNLIGGIRILMGDRRVDGTVAGRLDAIARDLFAHN